MSDLLEVTGVRFFGTQCKSNCAALTDTLVEACRLIYAFLCLFIIYSFTGRVFLILIYSFTSIFCLFLLLWFILFYYFMFYFFIFFIFIHLYCWLIKVRVTDTDERAVGINGQLVEVRYTARGCWQDISADWQFVQTS